MSTRLAFRLLIPAALLLPSACSDEPAPAAPVTDVPATAPALNMQAPELPGERQTLVAIEASLDAAWNAKLPAAYAASFAEDVQLITPTGGLVFSRGGVQGLHTFLFNGPFAGSTRQTTSLEIRFLTGTLAVADRVGDVSNYAFVPPGVTPTRPGVITARERHVFERRGGTWQIILAQITPVAPSAP